MVFGGDIEIQTLALLQALVERQEPPVAFARRRARELASRDLENLAARIWILIERLGYPEIDPRQLASSWAEQISRRPAASRRELLSTARQLSRQVDAGEGPIGAWRRALLAALQLPLETLQTVESFAPGTPLEERRKTLALKPLLTDWPRRILESREWAYADAPLPDMEPLPLSDVWVDLQWVPLEDVSTLASQSTIREALDQRYEDRHWHSRPIELAVERLEDSAVLVGPPGSGKTTLLKWIARKLILQPKGRFLLPLLVPLRSYGAWRKENPGGGLLEYALVKVGVTDAAQRRLWANVLSYMVGSDADCVLLLLDGWDEVRAADRRLVYEEIENITHAFPVVVTSRPSGYPRHLPILDIYQIVELSPASIDTLIHRWFQHIGKPQLADELRYRLVQSLDLRRMARNPFLLSLMCGVSWRRDRRQLVELPQTRAALYESAVALIYTHHDQRYPESPFGSAEQRQVERLALWLLDEAPGAPRFIFGREDIAACAADPGRLESLLLPSRLLSQLGLSDESYHFIHATFQEFLAARGLALQDIGHVLETLRGRLLDVAWLEVLQFLAGQEGIHLGIFWQELARLCKQPDRFGHVFLRISRLIAEAAVQDGGIEELGVDLRDELWRGVVDSNHSSRFFEAMSVLDSSDLLQRVQAALDGDDRAKDRCSRNLGRLAGPEASDLVVQRLLEADPVDFPDALEQLRLRRYLHPRSLSRLRRASFADDLAPQRRKSLLHALSEARDLASIPKMVELARRQPETATMVLSSLGWMGGSEAAEALEEMADWRSDDAWRREVVGALGLAGTPEARDALLQGLALMSEDDPLVPAHLEALSGMPMVSGTPLIKAWLADQGSSEEVRVAAAKALESAMGSQAAKTLAEAARDDASQAVRIAALESFQNRGKHHDIDWLAARVMDTSRYVEERRLALLALLKADERFRSSLDGEGGRRRAESLVLEILSGEPEELLVKATAQLAHLVGEGVGPRLVEIAVDSERSTVVRVEACKGLARLRFQAAVEALVELVRQGPESRLRDRRPGLLGPWTEELPFRMTWHGDHFSTTTWSLDLKAAEQEVGQAAADALARIDPSHLLALEGSTAANALSGWALETGSLVFEDHILGPDGRIFARHPTRGAAGEASSGDGDGADFFQLWIRVPEADDAKRLSFELVHPRTWSTPSSIPWRAPSAIPSAIPWRSPSSIPWPPPPPPPPSTTTFEPVDLGRQPRELRRDLIEDMEAGLLSDREQQAIASHRLRSKGATLFEMLPEGLRSQLLALRHTATSLQLVSQELYLPWETLLLTESGSDASDAGETLVEAFPVTRWAGNMTPRRTLSLCRVAVVAKSTSGDSEGQEEFEALSALLGDSRVEWIPPRYHSVRAALAGGTFDAWHFAGHGFSQAEDADRWELELEDGHALRPEDLREPGFGLRCPWVFLNACSSGLADASLAGPSGWALQCLEAGAGVFVGTHWAVPAREARVFALALYKAFLLGHPLAEAVRQARLQVKEAFPDSPTWLAYAVYGHPRAVAEPSSRLPPAR